jgi:hypothetical protein
LTAAVDELGLQKQLAMKRDMGLVRDILLTAEALKFEDGEPYEPYRAKTPDEAYQIALMKDAGLVDAAIDTTHGIPEGAAIVRLTWAGHEFLDSSRDNKIWKMAKKHVLKPGMSWTFSLLSEWLKQQAHDRIFGGPAA